MLQVDQDPAEEIEGLVCRRIQSLLSSPEQLLQSIGVESDVAATSKSLIGAGKQLAKNWQEKSPAEHREFLSAVIARIVIHEATLEIAMIHPALRKALLGDKSGIGKQECPIENRTKDVFKLMIDARVKRCGGEVRLLVPADSATEAPARPDIVEAILDGRQPADLTVQKLLRCLPLAWSKQRKQLGFGGTSLSANSFDRTLP